MVSSPLKSDENIKVLIERGPKSCLDRSGDKPKGAGEASKPEWRVRDVPVY